eukprot:2649859-Prymnesium_polylepis.1
MPVPLMHHRTLNFGELGLVRLEPVRPQRAHDRVALGNDVLDTARLGHAELLVFVHLKLASVAPVSTLRRSQILVFGVRRVPVDDVVGRIV